METKNLKDYFEKLNIEELEKLKEEIEKIINSKRTGKIRVRLETDGWYDRRKHGGAYVAIIQRSNGKIERKFVEITNRVWDKKGKYYKAEWEFEVQEGDKIEARLYEGSWKNEARSYYIVRGGNLEKASREEVLGL